MADTTNKTTFDNVSDIIGDKFSAQRDRLMLYINGDIGSGAVFIERLGFDGNFHRYAAYSYTSVNAWEVNINANATLRIVVEGATSVDVELVH